MTIPDSDMDRVCGSFTRVLDALSTPDGNLPFEVLMAWADYDQRYVVIAKDYQLKYASQRNWCEECLDYVDLCRGCEKGACDHDCTCGEDDADDSSEESLQESPREVIIEDKWAAFFHHSRKTSWNEKLYEFWYSKMSRNRSKT